MGLPGISAELSRMLFVLVALVFVGWFALGTHSNVRRGNAVLRWLQEGLPLLGQRTTLRWLGSSAIELKIQNVSEPLRLVEVFIVLEPRDLPFIWGYFHARGRRDILIVRGQAASAPLFELEAVDPDAWSTRGIRRELSRRRWSPLTSPAGARVLAYGEGRLEAAQEMLALAAQSELPLVRLAIHRAAPHLEVQWQLRRLDGVSARRVIETFRKISEEL